MGGGVNSSNQDGVKQYYYNQGGWGGFQGLSWGGVERSSSVLDGEGHIYDGCSAADLLATLPKWFAGIVCVAN